MPNDTAPAPIGADALRAVIDEMRIKEARGAEATEHELGEMADRLTQALDQYDAALASAAAPKAESVPAGAREELREGASYESMNLAAMVLSDCGHSSNYEPLLERVAGRIDRHVERLLTAQREALTMRAQAAPAAVAGPSDEALRLSVDHAHEILRRLMYHRDGDFFINVNRRGAEAIHARTIATIVHAALVAAPTTQAAPAAALPEQDRARGAQGESNG